MQMNRFLSCLLALLGTSLGLQAQPDLALSLFATGFDRPVDIAQAGDNRLFVVERPGQIWVVTPDGTTQPVPFLDIRSQVRSNATEQGLLGLAFHPNYAQNGYFFVNYTTGTNATKRSRISRFSRDPQDSSRADISSELILLEVSQPFNNHNAGDLNFGPDGYLYAALGDGGSAGDPDNYAQNTQSLLGKILRLDVNSGTPFAIPSDNPFVGVAGYREEIWSLGWRNPWRFSFDRATGDMWVADVGQDQYEEISFEPAGLGGRNYGWRCLEADNIYNAGGCGTVNLYTPPAFAYLHNSVTTGKSVTGGYVYRGQDFPALQGHYVLGDYKSGNFWTVFPDGNGGWSHSFQGNLMGVDECSTFGEDAAGELYVAAYGSGTIYRVTDTSTPLDPGRGPGRLRVYPQPLRTAATVELPGDGTETFTLHLYDLQGRLLREVPQLRGDSYQLPRTSLLPGLHLLRLTGSRGTRQQTKLWVE